MSHHQVKDKVIQDGKIFAVISYILFLSIVTLLLKKENKFALFHGKQGLVILILLVASSILGIMPLIGPLIWILARIVLGLVSLAGIVQALMGNYWRIPLIGDMADKIKI